MFRGEVYSVLDSIPHEYPATVSVPILPESGPYAKRQQLLQELLDDSELLLKNRLEVRHLMTRELVTVPPSAKLEEITELMRRRRLHHLLVCGRGEELVGVISDRDLCSSRGMTAQQLMSYPPRTCSSNTSLNVAISSIINENISCLPVVDEGRLCGVLTTTDLVLTLQSTLQLWMRLTQVIQHDQTWIKELDEIAASLDGEMSAEQLTGRSPPPEKRSTNRSKTSSIGSIFRPTC